MRGITKYSHPITGTTTTHNLTARFDMTDGCLGISQWEGTEIKDAERVLLSKAQVKALIGFLTARSGGLEHG